MRTLLLLALFLAADAIPAHYGEKKIAHRRRARVLQEETVDDVNDKTTSHQTSQDTSQSSSDESTKSADYTSAACANCIEAQRAVATAYDAAKIKHETAENKASAWATAMAESNEATKAQTDQATVKATADADLKSKNDEVARLKGLLAEAEQKQRTSKQTFDDAVTELGRLTTIATTKTAAAATAKTNYETKHGEATSADTNAANKETAAATACQGFDLTKIRALMTPPPSAPPPSAPPPGEPPVAAVQAPVKCASIVKTQNMFGRSAKGVDLSPYMGDEGLLWIGCQGDGCTTSSFYCTDTANGITFGTTYNSAMRSCHGVTSEAQCGSYSGCCKQPGGLCNSPDKQSDVTEICIQLGYSSGTVEKVNSNFCPEVHWDGSAWISDFVTSHGYGKSYTCTL